MSGEQTTLHLPQRDANDILREQLHEAEELFNTEQDAAVRIELFSRIRRLREILGEVRR